MRSFLTHPLTTRVGIGFVSAAAGLCLLATQPKTALAQTTVYDNTHNLFSPQSLITNGGAATTGGTALTTTMIADDIHLAPGAGGANINEFIFAASTSHIGIGFQADAIVTLYAADGTGGGPGTLLTSLVLVGLTFTHGITEFDDTEPTFFTAPLNGSFWAGISFSNVDFPTTTAAQLNSLGLVTYNPPTVGSSQDLFFHSTDSSAGFTSNPAGTLTSLGGSPAANFGWGFVVGAPFIAPVDAPEPASAPLLLSGLISIIGFAGMRR